MVRVRRRYPNRRSMGSRDCLYAVRRSRAPTSTRDRAEESMTQAGRVRDLDSIGVLVAVGLTAVVISANLGAIISAYDGGISSSAATFTLHGLLPYRDYWLLYGPLSGALLAIPTALL